MKNIFEKFNIELSEKTESHIKWTADKEWEDFQNNGDMFHDIAFDHLSLEEVYKCAFREGYWNAMMDTLRDDAETDRDEI